MTSSVGQQQLLQRPAPTPTPPPPSPPPPEIPSLGMLIDRTSFDVDDFGIDRAVLEGTEWGSSSSSLSKKTMTTTTTATTGATTTTKNNSISNSMNHVSDASNNINGPTTDVGSSNNGTSNESLPSKPGTAASSNDDDDNKGGVDGDIATDLEPSPPDPPQTRAVVMKDGKIRRRLRWRPKAMMKRKHSRHQQQDTHNEGCGSDSSNNNSSSSKTNSSSSSSSASVASGGNNSQVSRSSKKSFHSFASTETMVKSNTRSNRNSSASGRLFPLPRPNYPKSFDGVSTIESSDSDAVVFRGGLSSSLSSSRRSSSGGAGSSRVSPLTVFEGGCLEEEDDDNDDDDEMEAAETNKGSKSLGLGPIQRMTSPIISTPRPPLFKRTKSDPRAVSPSPSESPIASKKKTTAANGREGALRQTRSSSPSPAIARLGEQVTAESSFSNNRNNDEEPLPTLADDELEGDRFCDLRIRTPERRDTSDANHDSPEQELSGKGHAPPALTISLDAVVEPSGDEKTSSTSPAGQREALSSTSSPAAPGLVQSTISSYFSSLSSPISVQDSGGTSAASLLPISFSYSSPGSTYGGGRSVISTRSEPIGRSLSSGSGRTTPTGTGVAAAGAESIFVSPIVLPQAGSGSAMAASSKQERQSASSPPPPPPTPRNRTTSFQIPATLPVPTSSTPTHSGGRNRKDIPGPELRFCMSDSTVTGQKVKGAFARESSFTGTNTSVTNGQSGTNIPTDKSDVTKRQQSLQGEEERTTPSSPLSLASMSTPRASDAGAADEGASQLEVEKNLQAIHDMANEHLQHGELAEASEVFEEILRGQLARYGEDHYRVGTAYHNIGIVHMKRGDYSRAVSAYREAVRVRKKALGEEHPDVAVSLAQLGVAYLESQKHRKAICVFREALKIRRQTLGMRHPKVAKILNNIGCALYDINELEVAMVAFLEALDIQRKLLRDSPLESLSLSENSLLSLASTQSNIASIKLYNGKFDEATVDLEEVLLIQQCVLGDDHATVKRTQASLRWLERWREQGNQEQDGAGSDSDTTAAAADVSQRQCLELTQTSSQSTTDVVPKKEPKELLSVFDSFMNLHENLNIACGGRRDGDFSC